MMLGKLNAKVQTADLRNVRTVTHDQQRGNSAHRGYGHKWRKARISFLAKNPMCVHCQAQGFVEASNVVDHIIPHRGDQHLFWSRSNWQALCGSCHSKKTAGEDGGFGNTSRFDGTNGNGYQPVHVPGPINPPPRKP
jgi:5-methylcytosine-specific restriction enzyme A